MIKVITQIFDDISPFLSPKFIGDMMVKTALLFYISFQLSKMIDKLFPDVDETKSTPMIWIEFLIQVGLCAVIAFLYRIILTKLGNAYDFLDDEMSNLSTKGASLIVGMSFLGMQKKLKAKYNILKKRV
tara:strand:+ start:5012 stop:5398 length:387 start_codon:yes stop_codon:yes gene_type:complete